MYTLYLFYLTLWTYLNYYTAFFYISVVWLTMQALVLIFWHEIDKSHCCYIARIQLSCLGIYLVVSSGINLLMHSARFYKWTRAANHYDSIVIFPILGLFTKFWSLCNFLPFRRKIILFLISCNIITNIPKFQKLAGLYFLHLKISKHQDGTVELCFN